MTYNNLLLDFQFSCKSFCKIHVSCKDGKRKKERKCEIKGMRENS